MEEKELMKETFIKWNAAVEFHNSGKYLEAIKTYGDIKETSARIYYNCACAYEKLGNAYSAKESLSRAIQRDEYLAVAFFHRGTLYLKDESAEKAVPDLENALKLLRGNTHIDYKPLGLYIRLNSIQIRFNLALAYAIVRRVVDAKNLLTEAFNDADQLQSKSLQTLQDRINENRLELVSAMQISADKVFTPPKDVIKNLEKKTLLKKAKVVSARNTDDRSPAFHGSIRVKVLKEKLNCSVEIGSNTPIMRIKGLFQKKRSDSTIEQPSTGLSRNCSFGDLVTCANPPTGSNEKRPPRSLLAGVRQLLNIEPKGQTSEPKGDQTPLLVRRGIRPTEDFGKLEDLSSVSNYVPSKDISASDDDEHVLKVDKDISVVNTELNKSIGSQSEKPKTKMHANSNDVITEVNSIKQRPPPPSYPPPPLPGKKC